MIKYTEYKYHLAALFSVAVWGATFVSTKVLIANSLTPAEIFLLRFAMAYICIWPLSGRRLWASGWRDEMTLAVAGITGGSLYFLTENMALEYAPASNVSLIVCTAPVWTAVLLSLLYRGERMTRRQAVGSALAFAGMVLVSSTDASCSGSHPEATCWHCRRRCCGWSIRWSSNASAAATLPYSSPARYSSTGC